VEKTIFWYLDRVSRGSDGYTLRITLLNGIRMNVALTHVLETGLVTDIRDQDGAFVDEGAGGRRFIPFTSIAFFDVES